MAEEEERPGIELPLTQISPDAMRILLGVPELPYEVTVTVRNKETGNKNVMFWPNVGMVNLEHHLTRDLPDGAGMGLYNAGMPQVAQLWVGLNASANTGKTLEVRDGGAMQEGPSE